MKYFAIVLIAALVAIPALAEETPAEVDIEGQVARKIVELLVQEDYQAVFEHFDERMREAMPVPKMEEFWTSLQNQAGEFESFGKERARNEQGYHLVELECHFAKMGLRAQVAFDDDKHIVGLFFRPGLIQASPAEESNGR